MDESSKKLLEDCFLRPITNARTTNTTTTPEPKTTLKTELQVLCLSDESKKMTMDTLRSIHGPDFQLDDPTKYKERGGHMKKSYWEDRGTLMVRSVKNFGASDVSIPKTNEQIMERFALKKLESYGFAESHCQEALKYCDGKIDDALLLLFRKYMHVPDGSPYLKDLNRQPLPDYSTDDLREDEKEALDSIYDKAFEEKEKNKVWNLKFRIDHLLQHSPSEQRKARAAASKSSSEVDVKKRTKQRERCRNFDKNGTCKFGKNCRFAHIPPETEERKKSKGHAVKENDHENWFFLEIRFPPNSNYPFEAPYIYLKTTCPDIPGDLLLYVSQRLYREACDICREGMPCVYSISETLQVDESISKFLHEETATFPNPQKSLFDTIQDDDVSTSESETEALPTHYTRGQTSHNNNFDRSMTQELQEDQKLVHLFMTIQKDEKYRKMMKTRKKLPAFEKMMDILNLINNFQTVVISGETGCGKSTQIPQFILDNWLFESSKLSDLNLMPHVEIICTQPRRLSAIGVAERVADERADRIGQLVGYQIRLENKISSSTRLTFCTTGILLRRLASDPLLKSVSHIVVDEVHERSEESDFLLMVLRRLLQLRPELKVILMSATLNAELFSSYFDNVPVLEIPGRTFPVEQHFLEDILEVCNYVMEYDSPFCRKIKKKEEDGFLEELEYADMRAENIAPPPKVKDEQLNLAATYARYTGYSKKVCKTIYLMEPMKVNTELIESVLRYIVDGSHEWPRTGSILVFLPGLQEIQVVHEALCDTVLFAPRTGKFVLVPLHSSLSNEEQSVVFRPAPKGKRKIVLTTNIAETSVTIDDCVFVIDCGLMKEKSFDTNRNMESLDLVWVSKANALQRKGRAGRVMPGVCIHLYTGHRYRHNILAQPIPEIHRVPLEQLILRIKTLPAFSKHSIFQVIGEVMEPPAEINIETAVTRLQDVGALDNDHNLTPLGHHLSALPVDVRIGKLMLFGAIFQCLDSVLTIAACLSHKSPFVCPFNKRTEAEKRKREFAVCNSDHLTCLMAYNKWLEVSTRNFFASRNYAEEHFLSLKTLQTISEVKYQFLELLVSIGFVPINVPRRRKNTEDNILQLTGAELNVNGNNNRLLISLLCASLYPNIVKILTPERSYIQTAGGAMPKPSVAKDLRFKTREDGYVTIHPSSVNYDVGTFQSSFLIYQEKVKTSRIFIRDCSLINVISLLLFAGSDLKIELHHGDYMFLLENGWIILKAYNHETAEMINCLRLELQQLLELKINDPCLNLLNHENGKRIIQTIIFLLSKNN